MRISDVEKQTGLTRKTIRFYEAKGLLTVGRSDNSYRDYDEAQQNYYTFQHDQIGVFAVPVTSTRLEATGAVFEAMSSESRVSVVPAYYDIALKGKYVRDEDSRTMIDIIHNGHLLDPAWIFCSNLGDLAQSPRNLLRGGSSDFASYYASKKKSYDNGLKVLIKAYEKKH